MRPNLGYSTLYWSNKDKKKLNDKMINSENKIDVDTKEDTAQRDCAEEYKESAFTDICNDEMDEIEIENPETDSLEVFPPSLIVLSEKTFNSEIEI